MNVEILKKIVPTKPAPCRNSIVAQRTMPPGWRTRIGPRILPHTVPRRLPVGLPASPNRGCDKNADRKSRENQSVGGTFTIHAFHRTASFFLMQRLRNHPNVSPYATKCSAFIVHTALPISRSLTRF